MPLDMRGLQSEGVPFQGKIKSAHCATEFVRLEDGAAKVRVTHRSGSTRCDQSVGKAGRVSHQKLIREASYGANLIVQRIRKVFVKERLGGLLHEFGIGEKKIVDWLRKSALHAVCNKPAPM